MKIRFRHKATSAILRLPVKAMVKIRYGFSGKVYRGIKPPYIILFNHVSLLDPLQVVQSFRHPIYFVASDFIFNKTKGSRIMQYLVSPISITKGSADVQTVKDIMSIVKQGGAVGLFPAGNTTYSGHEPYIPPSTYKLVKKLKVPVVLYRTDGLYGVDPRWGRELRRGKATGQVQRVLTVAELASMTTDEIAKVVRDNLQTPDNRLALGTYRSKHHAEYLERALFWCPQCHSMHSMHSSGDTFSCTSCGFSAVYHSDLTFTTNNPQYNYRRVSHWFDAQKQYIQQFDISKFDTNTPIFSDEGDSLYYKAKYQQKELIQQNITTTMYTDRLVMGDTVLPIMDIQGIAMQNRGRILIYSGDNTYMLLGQDRTCHYKYLAMNIHLHNLATGENNYELLGL